MTNTRQNARLILAAIRENEARFQRECAVAHLLAMSKARREELYGEWK